MNPIDPNSPAYPFTITEIQPIALEDLDRENVIPEIKHTHFPGMPIRLEIASRVMQGFMSDINGFGESYLAEPSLNNLPIHEAAAASSLAYADALIAAHNDSTKNNN